MTEYETQQINNPDWDNVRRVHDWRNYISRKVRSLWETFTIEQREALYRKADERAMREHWD